MQYWPQTVDSSGWRVSHWMTWYMSSIHFLIRTEYTPGFLPKLSKHSIVLSTVKKATQCCQGWPLASVLTMYPPGNSFCGILSALKTPTKYCDIMRPSLLNRQASSLVAVRPQSLEILQSASHPQWLPASSAPFRNDRQLVAQTKHSCILLMVCIF